MSGLLDLGMWRERRVELIKQTELAECGLACLAMIAAYHGQAVGLGALRRRFPPSIRGATLKSIIQVADEIGFVPRPIKLPLGQLNNVSLPAILHWDMDHFVVAERGEDGRILIHDPNGSSRWYRLEELSTHFTGVALELTPGANFQSQSHVAPLKLSQLWGGIHGLKRSLGQLVVLTLVLQCFVLAAPYYMQIALDSVVPASDLSLLAVLAVGFGLFALMDTAATVLRSFVLLSISTTFGYGVASNIGRRLLRLPVEWFERRHVGEVLSRFQSVLPIQALVTEGAIIAVVDGALAVFSLAIMYFYSVALAIVVTVVLGIYTIARLLLLPQQREATSAKIVARGAEQTHLIESLRSMTTIRLANKEVRRHVSWQSKLVDSTNASTHVARLTIWSGGLNKLLFGLENVVSVYIAIRLVLAGGFTVGMMFAYMSYKTNFLKSADSLVNQLISLRMVNVHLDNLADIASADEDISFRSAHTEPREFKGSLELRGISYRYSPNDPLILDDVDLKVEAGDHIAITGPSGGGKSTLSKILLGLIEPQAGEVVIDGIRLAQFGHKTFHDHVAGVLQDDTLFLGSVLENIVMFDDEFLVEEVEAAARAAAIHEEICAMPMGYNTIVGSMGSALSGGQRQRILLARALYRKPSLLVMDEGTAHLDADNEARVNSAISGMGITRIIIAHRKETVMSADCVYDLHHGRLAKRVNHSATNVGAVVT